MAERPATAKRVPIERLTEPPASALPALRAAGRPAVLVGAARAWPAIERWTPAYFKERYGDLEIKTTLDLPVDGVPYLRAVADHRHFLKLSEFLELLSTAERPCYVEQAPITAFAGLIDDLSIASLGAEGPVNITNLWLGSAGTRSGLHSDGGDNVIVQILGRKRVLLIDPKESRKVYPLRFDFTKSAVDPEHPDLESFPRFQDATVLETVLEPGDMLFLPRFWWHHLTSLDPSISINHWHGRLPALREYLLAIHRAGAIQWYEVIRQMIVHGLLGRPSPPARLYAPPMTFGERAYRMLTGRRPKPMA